MPQKGTIRIKIFALISNRENDTKTLRKRERKSKSKKDLLAYIAASLFAPNVISLPMDTTKK